MTERFSGKVALIAGAGSGIGRACAQRLSSEGARLLLQGRTPAKLSDTAASLPGVAEILPGDVSRREDNARLAAAVRERFGRLDVLINSAGIGTIGMSEELTAEEFQRVLSINLVGLVDLTRRVAPLLRASRPSGAVINIASTLGLSPIAGTLAYSASKAGVIAATSTLAAEWGPGIRVNCVCPGIVDTPMQAERGRPADEVRAWLRRMGKRHPLRRVGRPDDIAAAVASLASDDAGWISGSVLVVDGGLAVAHS